MAKLNYGVIHFHSEHSLHDSASKMENIVSKCSEMGAPALALSDHGTLTGIFDFIKYCKKYEVKPVPSVELYMEEVGAKRSHALLIPKDIIGYHAMCNVVTDSNKNIIDGMPITTNALLEHYFGPSSEAHGHVFFTSACMGGVLSNVLLRNTIVSRNIEKIEQKLKGLNNPNEDGYKKMKERIENILSETSSITEEIHSLEKIAKRSFLKREKAILSATGEEKEIMQASLDADKQESLEAKEKIDALKSKKALLAKEKKEINDVCKAREKDHDVWRSLNEKIEVLKNELLPEEKLKEETLKRAKYYENLFGKGNFYIELQNHRIDEELIVMPILAEIAQDNNFPVLATNDAHMIGNSDDELKARQIMCSLRFNKWREMQDSDKELYIKSDEELRSILCEIIPENIVDKAILGIGDILSNCNIEFKHENHYPKFKSPIAGQSAEDYLREMAYNGIAWRYPGGQWTSKHQERLEYELEVIKKLDVCDYLCIVEDFLKYGRLLGKIDLNDPRYLADPYNVELLKELAKGKVGLGIGPGRGSAVGSIVCYLIGITGIDPIKYNLLFERFLNLDRVSMPDIDSDFKPDIRDKVLDYVKNKYGPDAVCCIMTKGTQQAKAAIRNCARLLGSQKYDDTRAFLSLGDAITKAVPKVLNIKLDDCWDELMSQFSDNKDAVTILNNAKLVEGTFTNIGMHAAGVIISDNGDVKQYIPLMFIPGTGQFATQCEKEEAEAWGTLKMDFLGLRNLGIITETLNTVQNRYGKEIDIEKVPFEPNVFKNIFSKGNTNSVFQFESNGMKQMLRQFKPESIEDVILLVAAYRPGPMQYLKSIIAVKHGREKPDYVIPEMESVLGTTYGYPVYQEQIMTIFNKFAGFSLGESDIIRRYMSKKKTEKFMAYKDRFIDGLCKNGAAKSKAEAFWTQLVDFSKYAFNKSHAAAYAFVAYYTAWLKHHYPKEYLMAVMNNTEFDKLSGLINDCKSFGINISPPNINTAQNAFSIDGASIVCGLSKIKNVGDGAIDIIAERNQNGPFSSFVDFVMRTNADKGVTEALIKAGAFDSFISNRAALVDALPSYSESMKKIRDKKTKLDNYESQEVLERNLANAETSKDKKAIEKIIKNKMNLIESINALIDFVRNIAVDNSAENGFLRLQAEKELVGAYISGHPLDSYRKPEELKCVNIADATVSKNINLMGIITDLRLTSRKTDGAGLAFFKLEDLSGSIDVCCFTKAFTEFKQLIKENSVVKISGKCFEDDDSSDNTILKVSVNSIETVAEVRPTITISVKHPIEWQESVRNDIRVYLAGETTGCALNVHFEMDGTNRKTNLYVMPSILNNKKFKTFKTE